ncbi:MAG TPA: HAD family phosphatase [Dehalococcoidia bacterium]|jgi:HAD superfamily hydrolase (TIGR01509 family)|nr:HAD family phosphatase [Dehalococcoidia bacterium]HIK88123.1 HAD family phosphatase [Dehalococcoidia bacterium]
MPDKTAANSRISAFIFDLDGTLVETERLKARSYANVVGGLTGANSPDHRAIELYERIVGSTDEMVCRQMIDEFGIAEALEPVDGELWKHLHQIRMDEYRENDGLPERLMANVYQHNIDLLRGQKAIGRTVSVATSSFSDESKRVLDVLGLRVLLDDIVGREFVKNPKPDPEIYLLAMARLGVEPERVIIIEDSPIGTQAAIASGAAWICVSTPFSRVAVETTSSLDPQWVVHDPAKLSETVKRRIEFIDQN